MLELTKLTLHHRILITGKYFFPRPAPCYELGEGEKMWQTALQHVTVLLTWLGTLHVFYLLPLHRSLVHSIQSDLFNNKLFLL